MAKNYRIASISDGARIWTENGDGVYTTPGIDQRKHIMDFFGAPGTSIYTIERKLPLHLFTIGDRLQDGQATPTNIRRIYFENKVIMLQTNKAAPIALDTAVKYVAVVAQPAAPANTKFLAEIEAKILKERPIRIKLLKKYQPATPKEFLVRFFTEWNNEKADGNERGSRDTIHVDDETVQTTWGRRRSLQDIFMLLKYYYPKVTLKETLELLINVLPKEMNIRSSYCYTIKRYVWYCQGGRGGVANEVDKELEFGYSYNQYKAALK